MKIFNPANQELIADVPADSPADVARKVDQARSAGSDWARTPLELRLGAIRRFKDALVAEMDTLTRTLTAEMGKPITQARNELKAMAGRLDFFLNETAQMLKEDVVLREGDAARPSLTEAIRHEPLGVVANVSAWNYPYFVGSNVFVPALLTGNTVVYKPSEFATLTGQHIARLLHAAGIPAAAFIPVVGGGDVGAALVAQPVNGVFFTGSYATGVKIAQAVAARLVKLQLELGGKDPTYVCDDVDAKTAAEGLADGAFYNTGQSCCSVERIYVHKNVAPAFIEAFVETVRGFKLGDPTDESTYIGPLARAAQLEVLESQVSDALNRGAKLAIGGKRITDRKGNYFQPTVLTEVAQRHAGDARRELRPDHRHPGGGQRRGGGEADERHRIRPDRRCLQQGPGAGRGDPRPRGRRQRVLELLRSGQPPAALDRPPPLGHRLHPVARRHPHVPAAQGLAPAERLSRAIVNIRAIIGPAAGVLLLALGCGHKNDFVPLNGAALRASTPRTIRAPMVAPAKFDGESLKGDLGHC